MTLRCHLDAADVATIACELRNTDVADLLGVLDMELLTSVLAGIATAQLTFPHEEAAAVLTDLLHQPVLPQGNASLALLAAVHLLRLHGLDVTLEPAEETRKLIRAVADGSSDVQATAAWLDPRVTLHEAEEEAMFERFSAAARQVVTRAGREASTAGVDVGPEHLLRALVQSDAIRNAVECAGGSPNVAADGGPPADPGRHFTSGARKALELSLREAIAADDAQIDEIHLLLGVLAAADPAVAEELSAIGVERGALAEEARRRLPQVTAAKPTATPKRDDDALIRTYLADIGEYPLLTKDEELSLAKAIEAGKVAREEMESLGAAIPRDRRRALRRLVEEGEEASKRFVQSNLRLVVSIAKKYQSSGVPLLDLIQEGNLGLMHAIEKYDWRKEFKFSTYATWWIRQAISRAIASKGRGLTFEPLLPQRVVDLLEPLDPLERDVLRRRFGLAGDRPATLAEVSDAFGVTRERIREIERRAMDRLRKKPWE